MKKTIQTNEDYEAVFIYDDNDNLLLFKDSKDNWQIQTYDDNNNRTSFKDSTGEDQELFYDENNNLIKFIDNKAERVIEYSHEYNDYNINDYLPE